MASVGSGNYRLSFAGDTYNTAWNIAQLMQQSKTSVCFATRIGIDKYSDIFYESLMRDGLSIEAVQRDTERKMGLYIIDLKGVERSFEYWRNSSAARFLAKERNTLKQSVTNAKFVHFSGITLAILDKEGRRALFDTLDFAKSSGSIISFDPNIRPHLWTGPEEIKDTIFQALRYVDIAMPSYDDEANTWGDRNPNETIERYLKLGIDEVVVKDGSNPTTYLLDGQFHQCTVPTIQDIRDTTGAGDAFNAGYLYGKSLFLPVSDCISLAQAVAGETICHFGAMAPARFLRKFSKLH